MVLYVVEMARWWDVCVYNGTIGHSHTVEEILQILWDAIISHILLLKYCNGNCLEYL